MLDESTVDLLWNNSLIFLVYSPLKDILTIAEGKGSLTIEEKLVDFLEEQYREELFDCCAPL